eukprot:7160867-Prymnesium_polylepis.1
MRCSCGASPRRGSTEAGPGRRGSTETGPGRRGSTEAGGRCSCISVAEGAQRGSCTGDYSDSVRLLAHHAQLL